MLCILSPAKTLNLDPVDRSLPSSTPPLLDEAATLAQLGQEMSVSDLQKLMKISEPLATRAAGQFQSFSRPFTDDNTKPALLTFAGEVYRGLDAASLSDDDLRYAHGHVAVLSGLYGLLRALDGMQPYRLEMGTRVQTPRGKGLYRFWGARVSEQLDALTEGHADRVVVNLASKEYSRVVKPAQLAGGMLTIHFKERAAGGLKTVAVYAKRARGEMARFAVTQRAETPAALREFSGMGYRFDDAASEDGAWVFSR